jgi:O-methyltransferase
MRTPNSALWAIFKFFRLNEIYRRFFKDLLPPSLNNKIAKITLKNSFIPHVIEREIKPKYSDALQHLLRTDNEIGDYLEFGVSNGTSLKCMDRVLKKLDLDSVRMFGFDSFEGMPPSAVMEDEGTWKPGEFASSLKTTKQYLTVNGINWQRTFLIKGWFNATLRKETIKEFDIKKAGIIMVDCNIYSSSKLALNFCIPLIGRQTVIFFDDWREDEEFGECRAFTEFLLENPQFMSEVLGRYRPTGKIFLVTNTTVF